MGKQGPCCHCGIKSTPLWRNGPPGKPVLCNACGSRWRSKGTLVNYIPLHACAFTHLDSEDSQEEKLLHRTKPKNPPIKVHNGGNLEDEEMFVGYDLYSTDTSNRSSSGSAISCSESCDQLGSVDGNEISGSVHSSFWDSYIPSKKRSTSRRPSLSSVERLRRDLHDILQEQKSSYLSECSEELLIYEREDIIPSAEIGLGGVLLKLPVSSTREESEESSLLVQTKVSCLNVAHVGSSCLTVQSQNSEISSSKVGKDSQDIGDKEVLKENLAKQNALTNESFGNTLVSDFEVLRSQQSHAISINQKPSNSESFKPGKEISSCSSHLGGGGMSLSAKRPLHLPYFKTSGGTSSDTFRAQKRPKEQTAVQNHSSKTSTSDFSLRRNSSMLSMKGESEVEPLKDLQMMTHSSPALWMDLLSDLQTKSLYR